MEAPIRLAEEVVLVGLGDTAADVVLQAHKKRHATRPAFVVSEVDDIEGNMSGYDLPPGLLPFSVGTPSAADGWGLSGLNGRCSRCMADKATQTRYSLLPTVVRVVEGTDHRF